MRRITCLTFSTLAICCMVLWVPGTPAQTASSARAPHAAAVPSVFVKMIDPVDSIRDPAGKVYRGGVVRPVNIGNGVIIHQGSAATVVLVRNGSGLSVQLKSLVIQGKVTPVTSNPGVLTGAAAEPGMAAAANRAYARFGRFMRRNTRSPVTAIKMGRQVVLMQGLTLSFVLNPVPTPHPAVPAARPVAHAVQPPPAVAAGRIPQAEDQAEYVCHGPYDQEWRKVGGSIVRDQRSTAFYLSAAFYASANPLRVSEPMKQAWQNYLTKTYTPVDSEGSFGRATCDKVFQAHTGYNDLDGKSIIQQYVQAWAARPDKPQIVHTGWKYVPGQDKPVETVDHYWCDAAYGQNKYSSSLIAGPRYLNVSLLMKEFAQFLQRKYRSSEKGGKVSGSCVDFSGPFFEDMKASEEKFESAQMGGRRFVETGWKPKTLPPANYHPSH